MNSYESKLYGMLVSKIEQARTDNKSRALERYADVNFYHAAVARELALTEMLAWMSETKEKLDQS